MYARTSDHFYLAMEKDILIFSSEIWVVTPCIGKILVDLHHQVKRKITGKKPWQQAYGRLQYPLLLEAMPEAGLE